MSDLVQRLRKMNGNGFLTCGEAADCIEALQARIDAIMPLLDESVERGNRIDVLEAALREIADAKYLSDCPRIARRVLEEK